MRSWDKGGSYTPEVDHILGALKAAMMVALLPTMVASDFLGGLTVNLSRFQRRTLKLQVGEGVSQK